MIHFKTLSKGPSLATTRETTGVGCTTGIGDICAAAICCTGVCAGI